MSDRAALYGDGIFETMFVFNGCIRLLDLHIQRLDTALYTFAGSGPADAVRYLKHQIKEYHSKGFWRIRLTIHRDANGLYTPQSDYLSYSIQAQQLDANDLTQQIQLITCFDFRIHYDKLSHLKSCSAINYVLAARQANHKQADAALILNHKQQIAETSGSNIFLFISDVLVTPPLTSGCLPGVMRSFVLKIARKNNIKITIRSIDYSEINQIQAAFVTNAIRGIQIVHSIDKQMLQSNSLIAQLKHIVDKELKNNVGDTATQV